MIALNKLYSWYDVVVQDYLGVKKEHTRYIKPIGLALLATLLALAGWYTYNHFAQQKEQEAYTIFNECLAAYEKATENKSTWQEVDAMCANGYERFKSTSMGAYILAIRVDALLAQQKNAEALEQLSQLLKQMSSKSTLYSFYKTKHALLQMDSADQAIRAAGVAELEQVAADTTSNSNDIALYYLGLHYAMNNENAKAKEFWTRLVTTGLTADKQTQSPWAVRAQEKLQYL
jgi:hypothetical protein